jgi:hypothetical protein
MLFFDASLDRFKSLHADHSTLIYSLKGGDDAAA